MAGQKSQKQAPAQIAPAQNQGGGGAGKGIAIGCIIGCVIVAIILIFVVLFFSCGVMKWGTGYHWPATPTESSQGL
jgi:hypothetical protein